MASHPPSAGDESGLPKPQRAQSGKDPPTDRLLGLRFGREGRVVIRRKLGEGGMGVVYLGWDELHDRPVAVKFLRSSQMANAEALARFKREGQNLRKIRHPNLVRVYGCGRQHGYRVLATEFVDGRDLYAILQKAGQLPVRESLAICRAAASGLSALHQHHIVHRDLKPENIMMRHGDGRIKVLDFGIAKYLDASLALTRKGLYLGTPAYSAPEQVRGARVDHRADIFSLGVIVYELLTGQAVFKGRRTAQVLQATLKAAPVPLQKLNREVLPPVARLIDKMLQKKPGHRPQSMEEVVDAVDRILAELDGAGNLGQSEGGSLRGFLRRLFKG